MIEGPSRACVNGAYVDPGVSLREAGQPAARVRRTAVLNIKQRRPDRGSHQPHPAVDLVVADDDLAALPRQPSDRGDYRCGPAGNHLGDGPTRDAIAPVVDRDPTFLPRQTEVPRQLDDRGAGHA